VRARLIAAVGVALAVGLAALYITRPGALPLPSIGPGGTAGAPGAPDPIRSDEAQTILGPDAIRAIDDPRFMSPDKARFVPSNAPVMGVSVGGEAHAYLLGLMSQHEIVNDQLGGRNIAVTW
jgi:hypothetical protein